MKFKNIDAQIFVPDSDNIDAALKKTTHMAVAAHPDDLEIMAYDGIAKCLHENDKWFFGVIVTNGAGSVKPGKYSGYSDDEFKNVRADEQKKAAKLGNYSGVVLLDYTSSESKDPENIDLVNELSELIEAAAPDILYTHNLADKHETHVAVAIRTIQSVRALQIVKRPEKLYGCEVWRSLDWMLDPDKTVFDVDVEPDLAIALLKVFESQISGAKKYDRAAIARRLANSTFYSSHATDSSNALSFAMDLTPLIKDDDLDITDHVNSYIKRFQENILENIHNLTKEKK